MINVSDINKPAPVGRLRAASLGTDIDHGQMRIAAANLIACLGPVGTYSEDAAILYFGSSSKRLLLPSLDAIFEACESGLASHSVVAVENSTEGAVPRTLDLLYKTELQICGELSLLLRHDLLTQSGQLHGVTRVRAHAQALAQCHGWLSTNAPHLIREAVSSNAEGARLAAQDPTSAAIGGLRSAEEYGLLAAFHAVQDDPNNRTRFFVLSRKDNASEALGVGCKTSIIVSVPNEVGALFRVVEPFARHGVSMSRFESRPVKSGAWDYNFYIDIVGSRLEEKVANALAELQQQGAKVKLLGSYFDTDQH
ncbi:prephenate dehydratase [Polaromonas sp. JS666]|uniref:prephenate dehydratase n=1 Tax=Polaromonas sp. (strain JS666 / ATCC BAA-500) TaxID=296591 RepID=UPI00005345E3|nr:prephenate dehydratase [Polaromonas sp. JS666]